MTTSTLPRLADQAVAARQGADLFRFGMSNPIPDAAFAKNADGSVTIKGVDFLKTGMFNGLTLVDGDLLAMVERFVLLRDSGIFLPPFRLDHSWSVLSVIGYVSELESYRRVDETDGVEKTFLRGDVVLTGSVDYEPAALVSAIKRGALRSRSSEIGYYITNAGVELPLVFYGCAYVDIPAVEGLAPVKLSKRTHSVPHTVTDLQNDPKGSPMDPKKLARLAALRALTTLTDEQSVELGELEEEATTAGVTDEQVEAAAVEETDEERTAREAAEATAAEEAAAAEQAEADAAAAAAAAEAENPGAAELAAARAEIRQLRQVNADRTIAELRGRGVVIDANAEDASALLNHDDEDVRRRAGALLAAIPGTSVQLSQRRGQQALSQAAGGAGSASGELIRVGMSKDEVGPLWAELSSEERKTRQGEYDAWAADRRTNGITD